MEVAERQKKEKRRDEIKDMIKRINLTRDKLNIEKESCLSLGTSVESYEVEDEKLLREREKYEQELQELEKDLEELKNFKRTRFLKNFRHYLNKAGVKLGDVERKAGVTAGYISRLESGKISADPSIEFILTAANLLGVSVEQLVNEEYAELSPTEEYIVKVIETMIEDTAADKIVWYKETPWELECIGADYEGNTDHPLFSAVYGSGESGYPEPKGTGYNSLFPRGDVAVEGNFYHGTLPATKSTVYITNIKEELFGKSNIILEMYMVDEKQRVKPICASDVCCVRVKNSMEALYREIETASSHLHIDDSVRNAFDMYMDKLPFA